MRSLKKISIAAALAGLLLAGTVSTPLAQRRDRTTELNERVIELYSAGRYADAIPIAQRLLALREKALGRDHPDVATPLYYLALLYHHLGRYSEAEPLYQRSLAIFEKVLGRDHQELATLVHYLASLYHDQHRYTDAEPLNQRALAIREKALGRDAPAVAESLNNLGRLYIDQGRGDDAEQSYQRALAIREKTLGPNHPDVATSLNSLGQLYRNQNRHAEAEPLFRRALAIREKALGREHPDVAESLNSLAMLYHDDQYRRADAEPLYQRSLAIYEKRFGYDDPRIASLLQNLCKFYYGQGRFAEAESLCQRSLAIREKALGRDDPAVPGSLHELASVNSDQARGTEAEPLHQRALAIQEKVFGSEHPFVAALLNELAFLSLRQGRFAEAESLYQRSLAIFEKWLGRNDPTVSTLLSNLATLYANQGRDSEAEPLLQRALAIQEGAFGSEHPMVETPLHNLAALYYRQSRYEDALPLIRRTVAQGTVFKLVTLQLLFDSQGRSLISAAQALTESYEVVQRAASSATANAISKLAARFAAGTGELAQLVRRDQDLTAEAESLDKAVVAFVSKPPAERSAAAEEEIRRRIEAVKAERERLSQVFNQRFPDYVALSKPQPVPLAETQALLADDEALLVFDFGAESFAWFIARTDADWMRLTISGSELDAQVAALRAGLTDPMQRFDPTLAHRIYQATFGALADRIVNKKLLSIVTNGAMTSLPPQLLVTKDPSGKTLKEVDWLVRSHAITILPSVASLKALPGESQLSSAGNPMIAFADPVFSKAARTQAQKQLAMRSITSFYRGTQIDLAAIGEHLPQLPGTRNEVKEIAAQLKTDPGDIKLGLEATETAVKRATLDQYRIVYFAAHGLVSGDLEPVARTKAEPALALTFPDKPNDFDDGLLTASEIAQLKLDADWVVLSACNTAAEEKPGAEALSGLARAFFYAGARSLIVSHWNVSDEAAARLMIGTFQAGLRDPKLSHAEALRQSILAMIDAAPSDAFADPRFWAPFVVVGEPAKPR